MKKQDKKAYGELENVMLTDEEYGKLKQKFPDDFEDRINAVGFYMDSSGKKYKSHYATILMWDRRDKEKKREAEVPKGTSFSNYKERETDYDALERKNLADLMSGRILNDIRIKD